ncbi:hypothetical protein LX36DRAFT_220131 [Colletotrichum falcatum]|nr:hypothetical protein LX36DRAFT_220131 [Colletotrichum falcatum]
MGNRPKYPSSRWPATRSSNMKNGEGFKHPDQASHYARLFTRGATGGTGWFWTGAGSTEMGTGSGTGDGDGAGAAEAHPRLQGVSQRPMKSGLSFLQRPWQGQSSSMVEPSFWPAGQTQTKRVSWRDSGAGAAEAQFVPFVEQ